MANDRGRPLFLGIDVGSTSTKLALFDERGRLAAMERAETPVERPAEGHVEIALEALWSSIIELAGRLARSSPGAASRVEGLGISSLCPGLTALSEQGQPLTGAITFMDRRSLEETEIIRRAVGGEQALFALSGNRLMPGSCSLSSMVWIRDKLPELYRRTRYFGHIPTFLGRRLTGRFGMDYSNASYTGLFRTAGDPAFEWSAETAAAVGIEAAKLPPLVPAWRKLGGLDCPGLEAAGFRRGLAVAMGGGDTACAALAVDVLEHDQVFESAGTSDVLTVCSDRPDFDGRFMNRCHVAPGRWLFHGAMSSTGAALFWLKDEVFRENGPEAWPRVLGEVEALPDEAELPVFLPYMAGERSPVWDPRARGVFFGLDLSMGRPQLAKAVMEGCAFGLRQLLEIVEARLGRPVGRILSIGGWASCEPWARMKADATGRRFVLLDSGEAAALGAAMLGAVAAGCHPDPRSAAAAVDRTILKEFEPRPSGRAARERRYRRYLELYPRLKDLFDA